MTRDIVAGELGAELRTREVDRGIFRAQAGELRAVAHHELAAARDRQGQEGPDVFLYSDPADGKVHRPRQSQRRRMVGAEQLDVDAA